MKRGNGNLEGILILVALLAVVFVVSRGNTDSEAGNQSNSQKNTSSGGENIVSVKSPDLPNISLGTGNAARAYQSYEEYISIDNRSKNSVNITGWSLKNGKDKRAYNLGGQLRYFAADTVNIGQGTLFISPDGRNTFQNIVLEGGENAIITTGYMGSQTPYKIVSFKENICSGYLENLDEYKFTPSLKQNCPRPANELGLSSLDTECRKFVERLSSCRTPEFDTRDRDGEICRNCVNGTPLSNTCVAFIKNHFSYGACIANHSSDENFSGRTWRVFLGHGWELWAKEYENIELFDESGRLVKSRSY